MKECTKCRNCYDDEVEVCAVDGQNPVFTIAGTTTLSGRYVLEARLGQGGMGIVFRAKHKFLKSSHAVKIILPSLVTDDENLLVRFRQEAILAASIDHPNVIRVTDFGVENDVMPFLVMEYIDGIPLSNYLVEGKPLTLKEAFDLFIPIAEGVAEAHRKGIVHRDLKPQNIMVIKNLPLSKAIKVLDFGLAKIKSADSYPSLIQAKTMNIVGSPPYMSPEQWSGEGVDHRTDIYALAVILYQMLTGKLPFQADSMPAMMYQHLTVTAPSAASLGIDLNPAIEAVVQKALEKDPNNRFESMDQMLVDLENATGTPSKRMMTGAVTEYMISPPSVETGVPTAGDQARPLSDTQKKRFYSYFDSQEKPVLVADPQLAQDFLEAQDKIESAKTEAINADLLVQELVEAQKQAEAAQDKAVQAKQRMEADVRRQVDAEMQRLAVEDQAKREADVQRLAQEIEARRVAEERANYLAQAALEAQQLAEAERKKNQEEAQKREQHQDSRREAELHAQQLAAQVAEAKREYEAARNEAAREAQLRADAENKQKQIENELQTVAMNEAERRKMVEAKAKQLIEEQAGRFEKEAQAARQRLDEARSLIELEAQKREKAEAARIHAEGEAERLSQEIIEVQRQMEEMRQHVTADTGSSGMMNPHSMRNTGSSLTPLTQLSGAASAEIPTAFLDTGKISKKKPLFAAALIGIFSIILLGGGGLGLYLLFGRSTVLPANNNSNGTANNSTPDRKPGELIARRSVLIEGGTFSMGSNDIADKFDPDYGNEFPAHPETVKSFNIDVYETTNGQYAEFVASGHKPPSYWANGKPPVGQENNPVTNVSLLDAKAYAAWISKRENKVCRLPSEIEWEYAARNGAQNSIFPWGTQELGDFAMLKGRDAVVVGSMLDETANGVEDMMGNVSEWTSSPFELYKGHPSTKRFDGLYSVRGLNFKTPDNLFQKPQLLLMYRQYLAEDKDYDFLGFRLVCEP